MALKRLVRSAATIALLGCSDGASESTPVPMFTGTIPGAGTQPGETAGAGNPAPAANTEPSAEGAGQVPAGQAASESQNPGNIGIDDSTGAAEAGGGQAPTDTGASSGQAEGMEPTGAGEQPGAGEPPADDTPDEPEPVPDDEPEPIVRPALDCGAPAQQLQGGVESCEVNGQGSVSGQSWFLWFNGGGGGCMTAFDTPSGAFSANWNSPGDFLARIGPWFDETQTHQELGEIGADMKFTRQGSGGGFSYIGIYGWTIDPLVEFYIVEDAFGGPPRTFGATQAPPVQGNTNFSADGGQYQVRTNLRRNADNITGVSADFPQIFSIRQSARSCGHVSISEHFRQWENRGLTLGRMKEAKIVVEVGGGNGNGSITFSHANVTVTPPE